MRSPASRSSSASIDTATTNPPCSHVKGTRTTIAPPPAVETIGELTAPTSPCISRITAQPPDISLADSASRRRGVKKSIKSVKRPAISRSTTIKACSFASAANSTQSKCDSRDQNYWTPSMDHGRLARLTTSSRCASRGDVRVSLPNGTRRKISTSRGTEARPFIASSR
jgi:hypothetical protein